MEELRARLFWDIPLNHKILHIFSLLQLLPGSLGFSTLPLIGLQSLMVPKAPATKALITWLRTRPICLNCGFRESSSQATCWLAPSWGHHLHNCSISRDATELRGCLHRAPGAVCACVFFLPQLWRLKSKNTAWAGWVCPGKTLPGLRDDHLLVLSLCGSVHEFLMFPIFS